MAGTRAGDDAVAASAEGSAATPASEAAAAAEVKSGTDEKPDGSQTGTTATDGKDETASQAATTGRAAATDEAAAEVPSADAGTVSTGNPAIPTASTPDGTAKEVAAKAEAGTDAKAEAGTDAKARETAGGAVTAPSAAALAAASRGRATRALRRANPVRVAKSTVRTTSAWAKRPSGRLILPAVIAALLLSAAGTAGALLVPQALRSVSSPGATPGFGLDPSGEVGSGPAASSGLPGVSAPVVGGPQPPVGGVVGGARPADVLASWAQETGTRAGIPVVAVQAYGYAELVLGRTTPSCHLSWTTIAAIAKVGSSHGSANGAVLSVDGSVAPPIRGLPLDGKGGRQEVKDTDQGALDGDPQFDRATGPLQFVPKTWTEISVGNGVDADNNGISDPNDIDDASLAAARYLCQGGRDLAKPDAWWDAVLSYNVIRPYAQKVFDAANDYGQRSRI